VDVAVADAAEGVRRVNVRLAIRPLWVALACLQLLPYSFLSIEPPNLPPLVKYLLRAAK
jgi:hypothetical protein